jgi:hypothetical protein
MTLRTVPAASSFDLAEQALLAQLRRQALAFLSGERVPAGAWLLANYLDLAQAWAHERRTRVYRRANQWLTHWAQQPHNASELERLAARSWAMRVCYERQLAIDEALTDARLRRRAAQRKRPFLNARDEMAFVERLTRAAPARTPGLASRVARFGT